MQTSTKQMQINAEETFSRQVREGSECPHKMFGSLVLKTLQPNINEGVSEFVSC